MAALPLFDVSTIDLTQVAVTRQRVGEINPQCGDMRQLDYVIWMSEDARTGVGVKHVRDDEFWVSGHIPGRPLLPGILMIEAAAQLCSVLQHHAHKIGEKDFLGFTRCDDVVFRSQVVPGDTMYLLAMETSRSRRRFVSCAQAMVEGQIVFEARITGMRI